MEPAKPIKLEVKMSLKNTESLFNERVYKTRSALDVTPFAYIRGY